MRLQRKDGLIRDNVEYVKLRGYVACYVVLLPNKRFTYGRGVNFYQLKYDFDNGDVVNELNYYLIECDQPTEGEEKMRDAKV
jgi:hypothetical protein